MNKRIKAGWIKKLRSGKFKQCRLFLRKTDKLGRVGQVSYCCLGVLTAMAVKNGVCPAHIAYQSTILNRAVSDWAGLNGTENPFIGGLTMSEWNDVEKCSFVTIADLIEKNL